MPEVNVPVPVADVHPIPVVKSQVELAGFAATVNGEGAIDGPAEPVPAGGQTPGNVVSTTVHESAVPGPVVFSTVTEALNMLVVPLTKVHSFDGMNPAKLVTALPVPFTEPIGFPVPKPALPGVPVVSKPRSLAKPKESVCSPASVICESFTGSLWTVDGNENWQGAPP